MPNFSNLLNGETIPYDFRFLIRCMVLGSVLAVNTPSGLAQTAMTNTASEYFRPVDTLPPHQPSKSRPKASYAYTRCCLPYKSYTAYQTPVQSFTPARDTVKTGIPYNFHNASPAAKIITGTAAGAALGGVIGVLTGLTMRPSSREMVNTTINNTNTHNTVYMVNNGATLVNTTSRVNTMTSARPVFVHSQYSRKPLVAFIPTHTTGIQSQTVVYQLAPTVAVSQADTAAQSRKVIRKTVKMGRGKAAARGLGWGSMYGAGLGLLGGIAYAYFTRDPVAISSTSYH